MGSREEAMAEFFWTVQPATIAQNTMKVMAAMDQMFVQNCPSESMFTVFLPTPGGAQIPT